MKDNNTIPSVQYYVILQCQSYSGFGEGSRNRCIYNLSHNTFPEQKYGRTQITFFFSLVYAALSWKGNNTLKKKVELFHSFSIRIIRSIYMIKKCYKVIGCKILITSDSCEYDYRVQSSSSPLFRFPSA